MLRSILVTSLVCGCATLVSADEFRVDSRVFIAKQTEPHSTNSTFFRGDHIYDLLDKPRQITVYDTVRGRIVLADPERQQKVEISFGMLKAFSNELRARPLKRPDAFIQFALRPELVPSTDRETGERVFSSSHLTYRVAAAAAERESVAARYRDFCDWSAQLNAMVNRGSMPPFPRLAVNEALASERLVPERIAFHVPPRQWIGGKAVHLRSEHDFQYRLLDGDLRRIEQAGETLAKCQSVGLAEFLKASTDAARLEKQAAR